MKKQEYQLNSAPLTVVHKPTQEMKGEMYGSWLGDLLAPFIMNPIFAGIIAFAIAHMFLGLVIVVIQLYVTR